MEELVINTPAKINLGLNIIRRREDGFHDLESVFYPINLYDTLILRKAGKFSFTCSSKSLENHDNLVVKAKEMLERKTGKIFHTEINLIKKIPPGSGMGGGSSDAAAALKGLNQMYNLSLNEEDLNHAALKLGSDIPFFLDPQPSFASSRGEVLEKISFRIKQPLLIVNPGIVISTGWAYSKISPRKPLFNLKDAFLKFKNYSDLENSVCNDFERVVFHEYPGIKEIKERMYNTGAVFSLMTGTGSTVFGIYEDMNLLLKAEEEFRDKYFTFILNN